MTTRPRSQRPSDDAGTRSRSPASVLELPDGIEWLNLHTVGGSVANDVTKSVQPVHQACCVVHRQSAFLQAEGVLPGFVTALRQYQAGHAQ